MKGLTIPFEHFQTNKIAGVNFTPSMKLVYFFLDANKNPDGVIHISQTDRKYGWRHSPNNREGD